MKSTSVAVTIEKLLEQLPEYYSPSDRELIQRAYYLAEEAHRPQKRASGEPYITHCLAVASILAELQVPPAAVAAGLLHDTVEDTDITLADLQKDFGGEITNLVDGVTKLTNLPRVSREDQHFSKPEDDETESSQNTYDAEDEYPKPALLGRNPDMASETLRKTFLAMDNDIRIVLIKLADRLHNMRTLGFMPEHKRKRIAKQTLEIFAPLANRMGIRQVKWELEDLSFRHTNPEKYKEIASHLTTRRKFREDEVKVIVSELEKMLATQEIDAKVSGRPKHIYSIYRKMARKNKPFEMVLDIRAVRIIVSDIPACYSTLGLIHTHCRPLPNEFDDYIAAPKDNHYQSLHTAVIHRDGKPLEIQIRTQEMHDSAEYGIAAHWLYKENSTASTSYNARIDDIRRMMEWRSDVDDAAEFVESMKTDVFQDRVYVFTPNGDIIDLPAGSTPIDFAYHIHTDVGHRCRGAKVNGKLVSLSYEVKTGEQLQILTAKRGGPSRDWLNSNLGLVKTQRAKSKMRVWFRKQDRAQNMAQGRTLLEKELQRVGVKEKTNFEKLVREIGYRSTDDLSLALGIGDISINAILPQLPKEEPETPEILPTTRKADISTEATDAIKVVGLKGLLTNIARCCNPTQGDEIIGYITRGRGASIHRIDCPNILRTNDRERLVRVTWGEQARTYPVPIRITAFDRSGLIGDITHILSNDSINLLDAKVRVTKGLADINLEIEVRDIKELSRLLTRIENIPNVLEAQRNNPG